MSTATFRRVRAEAMADPAFRAEVARERALMMAIDVSHARKASGMTQQEVAAALGTSQENISRIERQHDMRVSTLLEFIQAQGGEVEITAVVDGERFSLLRPAHAEPVEA